MRGTPFDVFGWTAERRAERRYLGEYLAVVETAMAHLTPDSSDAVRALVDSANQVHGYSHVRQASMARVRADVTRQLKELTGQAETAAGSYPIAG